MKYSRSRGTSLSVALNYVLVN